MLLHQKPETDSNATVKTELVEQDKSRQKTHTRQVVWWTCKQTSGETVVIVFLLTMRKCTISTNVLELTMVLL